MATSHRPDFQAFRREAPIPTEASEHRDAYIWPFVNEEDLTKPRALLHFLNARGRTPPSEFAASDLEAMQYGILAKAVVPLLSCGYIMLFRGKNSPGTYGQLLDYNAHRDAQSWSETRREMQPGEGLLVLESQERTLDFLVKCAREILHDIESPLDHPIEAPQLVPEPDTGMSSLAAMAAEAPYRPPAEISFARIESLLGATRDAASDHLCALREDPAYFATCVLEAKEHRLEMMKDTKGLPHPLIQAGKEDVIWARAVNRVIADAHLLLELWTNLHNQAIDLGRMHERYAFAIDPEKDLPQPYMDALLRFKYYLGRVADQPLAGLKMAYASSPPLRHLFCAYVPDDPMSQNASFGPRPNARPDERIMYITWLFREVTDDDHGLAVTLLSKKADALQHFVDTDPRAKPLVTSYIAAYISDLSIVGECLRQIECYQPWANTFEYYTTEKSAEIDSEYDKSGEPWVRLLLALKRSEHAIGRYANIEDGRFNYPVERRKTKENVAALQRAEKALDTFWGKVDEILHLNIKSLDGLAAKELLGSRRVQRTPDWVEPTKTDKFVYVEEISKPLSEIYFDLEHRTESAQSRPSDNPSTLR